MRRARGFSLIEVLIALLILSVLLLASMAVVYHREKQLAEAEQTIIAWQILASEAELRRFVPYRTIIAGESAFIYDGPLLGELPRGAARAETRITRPGLAECTLIVEWGGRREAKLIVWRADEGAGEGLW